MRAHKWSTAFFFLFGVFWAITLPYMSYLFGEIIDHIKVQGIQSISTIKLVMVPLALYIVIHVLRSIGYYVHGICSLLSIPSYKCHLVRKLFSHLGKQSIDYFEKQHAGFISNKITNTCTSLEPIIFNISAIIFPQSLAIILTGIMLSMVVPYFGIVLWVWGISIIIYTYYAAKIGRKNSTIFADACSKFNGHVVDVIANIQTVIDSAAMSLESKLLDKNLDYLVDKERIRNRHSNNVMLAQHLAMNLLVAFYLVGSVVGFEHGLVSLGEVVFVMTAVIAIASLTSSLGSCFLTLIYNIGIIREGLGLLESIPDVPELESAKSYGITAGAIAIDKIGFAYPNRAPVFDDFSLEIPAKQKLGVVGSSGAGKSTFMKLLMRLYDVNSGCIKIDNVDIREYTKDSLRSQIGVVQQNLSLFHRTIFDNIAYGSPDATEDEVFTAAKQAKCHDFIIELENGYHSYVGDKGVKLSGGQRQRIAIAQAILRNTPMQKYGYFNYAMNIYWSLSVEEVFYLAFPLACILLRKSKHNLWFAALLIIIGPIYRYAHQHDELYFMYGYLGCFDAIAFGCVSAILQNYKGINFLKHKGFQLLASITLIVTYVYGIHGNEIFGFSIIALMTATLILGSDKALITSNNIVVRGFSTCIQSLGRLSYELYLFHIVVLGVMRNYYIPKTLDRTETTILLFAYLVLSVIISWTLNRYYYSEPLNTLIRRFSARANFFAAKTAIKTK